MIALISPRSAGGEILAAERPGVLKVDVRRDPVEAEIYLGTDGL